jgi:O-antigen ligase
MACWLLSKAHSATALGILVAGICFLVVSGSNLVKQHLALSIVVSVALSTVVFLSFDVMGAILSVLNRDPTLTGRTALWEELIQYNNAPMIGAGYETFWVGNESKRLWEKYWWHPNEAHNGYLEIYINLGAIGLLLLVGIIIGAYRNVKRSLVLGFDFGRFRLAFLGMMLLYNITESAFKALHPMWFVFLLLVMEWPRMGIEEPRSVRLG